MSYKLEVAESEITLDRHLTYHLRADDMDLTELMLALEDEFEIEITDEVAEKYLGIGAKFFFGDPLSLSISSTPSSSSVHSFRSSAGEQCIVRNFVELIWDKITS